MHQRHMRRADIVPAVDQFGFGGQRKIGNARAKPSINAKGILDGVEQAGLNPLRQPLPRNPDPEPRNRLAELCHIIGNGGDQGGRVCRIGAGDDTQHDGDVLGRTRDDPHVIEQARQFESAMAADAAPARLEAGDAVDGAGHADGAAGVGGHGRIT